MDYVIEMLNIRKEFPGIVANDNITLQLKKGEIHALLGENGAGKSTLMNVLFGLYQPEQGEIRVKGKKANITNPNIANDLRNWNGPSAFYARRYIHCNREYYTWIENLKSGATVDIKKAEKDIQEISERYGLKVDPSC